MIFLAGLLIGSIIGIIVAAIVWSGIAKVVDRYL